MCACSALVCLAVALGSCAFASCAFAAFMFLALWMAKRLSTALGMNPLAVARWGVLGGPYCSQVILWRFSLWRLIHSRSCGAPLEFM